MASPEVKVRSCVESSAMHMGGAESNWVVRSAVPSVAGHGVGPVIDAPACAGGSQGISGKVEVVSWMVGASSPASRIPAVSGRTNARARNPTTPPTIRRRRRSLRCST